MQYLGELTALIVAISWTVTALFSEIASKRLGMLAFNVIRMAFSLVLLSLLLWCITGSPIPKYADSSTWMWLALSGLVGYVFGDFCLFNSYILIGSRFGQLFMTLSSVFAAITGFILLDERLSALSILGVIITMLGIGISVMNRQSSKGQQRKLGLKLPMNGVLFGIGAALGQGVGLVLSKMGVEAFAKCTPDNAVCFQQIIPFSGTWIRSLTGFIGFLLIMATQHKFGKLRAAFHERTGLKVALGATIFGPFIGVSLSLMAVQYTATGIAQTIMAITPILILLPAHFILKQQISPKEILGAVISVLGVSLFFI